MSEEKELKKAAATVRAYKDVFATTKGRIVLKDMIKEHFILSTTHEDGNTLNDTLFREGARNVVLRILGFINTDPSKFLNTVNEIVEEDDNVI